MPNLPIQRNLAERSNFPSASLPSGPNWP